MDEQQALAVIPRHVAIVMDGNGRWAQSRGKPRHAGHQQGAKSVRQIVESAAKAGVDVLTLFAFSSENWLRPQKEVDLLMDLFMVALGREVSKLHKNNIRLRVIGDVSAFPVKLQKKISQAEEKTAGNTKMVLQIAANYGGKWDITQAINNILSENADRSAPLRITEDMIDAHLSFAGLPDVDFLIRTGGDIRISNFILWQAAYAELYFTPVLWPDFNEHQFMTALHDFARRQRRFGKTAEQIIKPEND